MYTLNIYTLPTRDVDLNKYLTNLFRHLGVEGLVSGTLDPIHHLTISHQQEIVVYAGQNKSTCRVPYTASESLSCKYCSRVLSHGIDQRPHDCFGPQEICKLSLLQIWVWQTSLTVNVARKETSAPDVTE